MSDARWPYLSHRTMAEVIETEALRDQAHKQGGRGGHKRLTPFQWMRLECLTAKERAANGSEPLPEVEHTTAGPQGKRERPESKSTA